MYDQAEKLRVLARSIREKAVAEIRLPRKTKVLAITSGKGGVGKTNFTVNCALALMAMGKRVLILDADLGLANVDVMLGLTPRYNLYHVLTGEKEIGEVISDGPLGLQVVSGGSGIQEMANLDTWQIDFFARNIELLEGSADYLLIDTGAGISRTVTGFLNAADEIIVVTTPEPTAIADAYSIIKLLALHKRNGHINLVVNKVESRAEADIAARKLSTVAERFLKINIDSLGYILEDAVISRAVKTQEPFFLKYPKSNATSCIKTIAAKLLDEACTAPPAGGISSFFKKITSAFN